MDWLEKVKSYKIENRSSNIIVCQLSKEETREIINRCKKEDTTINSMLAAALILSMKNYILQKYGVTEDFLINTSSGLNLRKFYKCAVSDRQLGCWAGKGYILYNSRNVGSLWDCSRDYEQRLYQNINSGAPFLYLKKSFEILKRYQAGEKALKKENNLPSVMLTNLGKVDYIDLYSNETKLEKISFTSPMYRNWPSDLGFGICALTYDNQLSMVFQYMSPAWIDSEAKKYVNSLLKLMDIKAKN